jgi:bile acid-coenzyme A ligase
MVPTMLLRVARLPNVKQRDFSSLAAVLQGGATCPDWLVRFWIDLVGPHCFIMSYGSTENVGLVSIDGAEWLLHPGSVGKNDATLVRILDEDGSDLPAREVGEIFMRNTEETGPSFEYKGAPPPRRTPDGFTSIGDMGWLDEDGYLYIADRRSDMIVSGGANVFPAEVEAALLEHERVFDAVVIGLPDEEWGQRIHALIQPGSLETAPSPEELRAYCRERLASFKVPKAFEIVERLPRSDAGKLNRRALAEERTDG